MMSSHCVELGIHTKCLISPPPLPPPPEDEHRPEGLPGGGQQPAAEGRRAPHAHHRGHHALGEHPAGQEDLPQHHAHRRRGQSYRYVSTWGGEGGRGRPRWSVFLYAVAWCLLWFCVSHFRSRAVLLCFFMLCGMAAFCGFCVCVFCCQQRALSLQACLCTTLR